MGLLGSPMYLLSDLGIDFLLFQIHMRFFGLESEPMKMVMRKYFWKALRRCLIHTLFLKVTWSSSVSLFEASMPGAGSFGCPVAS